MNYNIEKIGNDLHNKRRKDFTLKSLAIEIGVNAVALSEIEQGVKKNYSGNTLLKVVTFIGKTLNDYVE